MRTLTPDTCLAARRDLLCCDLGDDSTVLLDPTVGVYLGVEGPAAVMWHMLSSQPVTVARLCDAVVRDFDVTRDVCEADVRRFVGDLLRRGLVTVVEADDASHAP